MSDMGNLFSCDDELPPKLDGTKEGTFVFFTISERWPKTIAKTVDHFHRKRRDLIDQYGPEADADVKAVIAELSELRYRIATDKPLEDISDTSYSYEMWNNLLAKMRVKFGGADELKWFNSEWLFAECYMYRRIVGCTAKTKYLKNFDFFMEQKVEGFNSHIEQIRDGIKYIFAVADNLSVQQERETLEVLLKMCLWGNRCDLSLSCGDATVLDKSPIENARLLDSFILCNDLGAAIENFFLKLKVNKKGLKEFHIVLDNAGPELMGDLIFAEYLMQVKLVDRTVLHGKEYPYFVSDVTGGDFEWTMTELKKRGDVFNTMYEKLSNRLKKNQLAFEDHRFWTYPHPYCQMKSVAPELYRRLCEASLIMFKGDLNYRKLVGDRDWPYGTPFKRALCGFLPAPILALRTLKSETVAGLPDDVAERMANEPDRKWMVTGEYGIAELAY
ncbi:Phage minor structural protein [Trichostrongylus colubriformis]|uniref:Sugar phosphate phosphatase n=1 Tax=Trichostrongylus colubriformis TaxID=6319 RepID=A0AAN8F7W7_TRICO